MSVPNRARGLIAAVAILSLTVCACGGGAQPQAVPTSTEPIATEPVDVAPLETGVVEGGPSQTEPVETESVELGAAQTEPVEAGPVQGWPPQLQPGQGNPGQGQPLEPQPGQGNPPQGQALEPQPGQGDAAQGEPLEPQPGGAIDLVGIWASEDMTAYGLLRTEMVLQRNGHYSYQVVWGELMTWEVGLYEAGEGFIHFALENYGPTSYKGTELSRPTSWTVFYTVVDQDTMIWEDRIMNTRWTVYRQ